MRKGIIITVLLLVAVLMLSDVGPIALLPFCLLGLAKVEGPLFSLGARGKVGDALVFFPWKGRHVVRRWLIPTNPRDINQKLIRQKMAAFGKSIGAVTTPYSGMLDGSALVQQVKTLTPAAQIWNAFLVKSGLQDLAVDAAWTDVMTEVHQTTVSDGWVSAAEALGLTTLASTADGFASDIPAWQQLVAAAYACYKMDYSSPLIDMSLYPSAMLLADVTLFASDFTNA